MRPSCRSVRLWSVCQKSALTGMSLASGPSSVRWTYVETGSKVFMPGTIAPGSPGVLEKSPASVPGQQDGDARRVARDHELAWRQPGELAEVGIEVRLVVVAGGEGHIGEGIRPALDHGERAAEADDAGVELRRHADLIAEAGHQARLREP